jgi:GxxExxY protein
LRPAATARFGKEALYRLSSQVLESAQRVHADLGSGLADEAYEHALRNAMAMDGLRFDADVEIALPSGGLGLDCGFRLGLLVEGCLVVEVRRLIQPAHVARLRRSLAAACLPCGLLIDFQAQPLRDGVRQVFSGLPSRPFSPSRQGAVSKQAAH